jgi:hypothetical protein
MKQGTKINWLVVDDDSRIIKRFVDEDEARDWVRDHHPVVFGENWYVVSRKTIDAHVTKMGNLSWLDK